MVADKPDNANTELFGDGPASSIVCFVQTLRSHRSFQDTTPQDTGFGEPEGLFLQGVMPCRRSWYYMVLLEG